MAPTTSLTRTAREYLRVSMDRSGRMRSPEEQHDENSEHALAEALTLGEPYRETGAVSASRYTDKIREAFALLLSDLEAGRFGADVLIMWEPSRGSRRVSEWCRLLEDLEAAGVTVYVTSHGRFYDPANARDRRALLEDAIDSEYESAKKSAGVTRAMKANARDGKPHGHCPFGYRRIYGDRTGDLLRQEIDPIESVIVREVYNRLNAGESLRAIERDFAARGITSRAGVPFSTVTLRGMALQPCYMGKRIHHTGKRVRGPIDPAILTNATWDEIVDSGLWWEVHNRLTDPARKTSKPGKAKHLLSILARCGVCSGPLTATFRYKGHRGYKTWQLVCQRSGHVRIEESALDEFVTGQIIEYLSRPENYVSGVRDTSGRLARIKGDIAEKSAQRGRLAAAVIAGMDPATAAGEDQRLAAEIKALEAEETRISTPAALSGLVGPSSRAEDIRARWDAASLPARREVVRLVMENKGVIHVLRHPSGGGAGARTAERVEWRRQAGV